MPGLEGTSLGRYHLQRRLGRGGMSEVYLAYDELMHRDIAIKVVSSSHVEYIERFQREAMAIANLHHNHILPAFDYGEQEPWHYLVMPYIEHETLSERLEKRGHLSLEEAGEMLQQIASGLEYAHEHGILHRDIKPSNILLRDDHHAYLADFGIAKAINETGRVTQTGVLLGTPEYMAPELADGPASRSSDLYALGMLLYQMVTGELPFTGNTGLAVYMKQVHERPIPPSRFNPTIPQDVEQVILRALDKDPRRRYQTPHALAHAYLQAVSAAGLLQEIGSGRTPLAMSRVVLNDTGEMPPLYEVAEELPQALGARNGLAEPGFAEVDVPFVATSFITPSPLPIEEEKLVLPAYAHDPGAPAASSPGQTLIQQPGRSTPPIARQVPVELTRTGSARYNRNIFAVTSFMGISFLLIIMSIILFAVFDYNNSNKLGEGTPAATARATHPSQPTRVNTAQAKDTSTPVANVTPVASEQQAVADERAITSSTPLLVDDLSSSVISSWNVDDNNCIFIGGTYHVIAKQANFLVPCESNILTYDNAAFQVDVSLLSGSMAGLVFRANDQQFYDFGITNLGEFFLHRHDINANRGGTYTHLIPNTTSSAIAPGRQKNTLLVIANGGDFKLYINGEFVGEQQDSTYTGGAVGFDAGTTLSVDSAEASFSNFKVYQVS
jgi:eukaryotic-like serine/threonine-protein kinase